MPSTPPSEHHSAGEAMSPPAPFPAPRPELAAEEITALGAELGRFSTLLGARSAPLPSEDDLRRAAAGILPLLPTASAPEAWAWDQIGRAHV